MAVPRIKGNLYGSLQVGKAERPNFSQKQSVLGLSWSGIPPRWPLIAPWQDCGPKYERHAAVCWHTSSFLTLLLLQKLFTEGRKSVQKEKVNVEDYFVRSPQKGLEEVSQHCQVMTENNLTQMHEPACSEVIRTVPLHIYCHPPAALFQREQLRNFSSETFPSYQWITLFCNCNI